MVQVMMRRARNASVRAVFLLAVVAVLLPISQATGSTAGNSMAPGAPPVLAALSPALQELIDRGLSTQEAVGKLLWSRPEDDLARAFIELNIPEAALKKIFANALADHGDALTAMVVRKDLPGLARAFANEGPTPAKAGKERLLKALRFWLLFDGRNHLPIQDFIARIKEAEPLATDEILADIFRTPFPEHELPTQRPAVVTGKVEMIDGMRVLKLWGNSFERGYAHGRLLGPEIFELWKRYVFPLSRMRGGYQRIAQFQDVVFAFPPEYLDELKGMVLGMRDSMTMEQRLDSPLGRDIELVDMMVGNTLSDWAEFGCSSITLWGDKTADGAVVTGRNLDYMTGASRVLVGGHLIVAYAPTAATAQSPARHGWVSVTFLGAVGCYTGMNEHGVTAMMHNTRGHHISTIDAIPRSLSQRAALERCDVRNMPDSFAKVLEDMRLLVPSNVHVSWPREFGNPTTGYAAAMELDGYFRHDNGVTVRRPRDNGDGHNGDYFVVTNHYCKRYCEPENGDTRPASTGIPGDSGMRMNKLLDAAKEAPDGSVTALTVREWLQRVGHSGTVHSVVFEPDTRRVSVMQPGAADRGGPWVEPKLFSAAQVLQDTVNLSKKPLEDF